LNDFRGMYVVTKGRLDGRCELSDNRAMGPIERIYRCDGL